MFQWLTRTRLHTALVILFFGVAFLISMALFFRAPNPRDIAEFTGDKLSVNWLAIAAMITAVVSVVGTVSTMVLAWRADLRTAKESALKLVQLQQQIKELESKLAAPTVDVKPKELATRD
jgi:cell shape-determining protein MreC